MTVQTAAVARPARREDAEAIARIYNHGIQDRIATFETEPRSTADIERLVDERLGRYPAIVVQPNSEVVAWASAGSSRACPCYDPSPSTRSMSTVTTAAAALGGLRSRHCAPKQNGSAYSTQAGEPHLS